MACKSSKYYQEEESSHNNMHHGTGNNVVQLVSLIHYQQEWSSAGWDHGLPEQHVHAGKWTSHNVIHVSASVHNTTYPHTSYYYSTDTDEDSYHNYASSNTTNNDPRWYNRLSCGRREREREINLHSLLNRNNDVSVAISDGQNFRQKLPLSKSKYLLIRESSQWALLNDHRWSLWTSLILKLLMFLIFSIQILIERIKKCRY